MAVNNLAITGKPNVGQELEADTSSITGVNGLTNVSYSYQWVRVDSDGTSNPTPIGTDSNKYILVAADENKKVILEATFTDDAGYEEEVATSAYPLMGTITTNNVAE